MKATPIPIPWILRDRIKSLRLLQVDDCYLEITPMKRGPARTFKIPLFVYENLNGQNPDIHNLSRYTEIVVTTLLGDRDYPDSRLARNA